LDFGDLINYCWELFKKRPAILAKYRSKFKYILVDEFQDTNYAQYELVKLLSGDNDNITVVGDDDQSIYNSAGRQSLIFWNLKKITLKPLKYF
jgi:DNA helicase-2/ATP-dependent DNA helicase PcrA